MRIYRLPFNALTVAAVQDLWAITAGASLPCVLEEFRIDPCATSVSEQPITVDLFTGTFTAGSGGSTLTPAKTDEGDAAASFSVKVQNTTRTAVGTGTKTNKDAGAWQLVNGYLWQPLSAASRILIPVNACLAIALNGAPASSTVSGCAIVSEGI